VRCRDAACRVSASETGQAPSLQMRFFRGRNRGQTMGGIRLRTKFLLSMVVVSAALTFTTLLVVRHTVQQEVRLGIQRDLENSVSAFRNFQKQREVTLERSAALLADLPNVRALMTTHDPATIQDASRDLWQLAGRAMRTPVHAAHMQVLYKKRMSLVR